MKSFLQARPSVAFRRVVLFGSFALCSLALMAASAPQCARVDDAAQNPLSSFSPSGETSSCIGECSALAVESRRAEHVRFVEAIKACQSAECRQEEAQLHARVMQEITEDQKLCQASCHQQGGGSGGN